MSFAHIRNKQRGKCVMMCCVSSTFSFCVGWINYKKECTWSYSGTSTSAHNSYKKCLDAKPHDAVSSSGWMLSAPDKLRNLTAILPTAQLRMLSTGLPICPGNFPLQVEEALKPTQYAHSKHPPHVFLHMLFTHQLPPGSRVYAHSGTQFLP